MAGPDAALRRLTRDARKLLQPYGFEGTEAVWIRIAPGGVASVGRTRTLRTWTGGRQELKFGLNPSATPIAWWEFCNWRNAQRGLPLTPLEQATGPGLIDDHGMADDSTELWSLQADPAQPGQVLQADVDAIRAALPRRVHACARRALRLLEPGRYLDELLALPDPRIGALEAIVVLLAERGPGPQLDEAFVRFRSCFADGDEAAYAENVVAYARGRAARI
ncbi:hypothetical protein [Nocardia gamkensis]|uniref:DUF4304 domain-containing protein n=1 Tax=Nocardia gamkensis TaxID=352869 RepID=A0A7X6R4S1_9NOCA|nr:hypothetical protein [Nocardia gamkensis]NKY28627.1 hypothetical protein [Nocardia gamkensis]NQE71216.1 hypothetical protein [Nocardia gamkensis]